MIDLMILGENVVPILMILAVKFLTYCPPPLQQLKIENMNMEKSKEQKKD